MVAQGSNVALLDFLVSEHAMDVASLDLVSALTLAYYRFYLFLTKNIFIDTRSNIIYCFSIKILILLISFIQAGWSTVHVACRFNSLAMVERLIALGADPLVVATGVWPSDNNSSWVVAICHTCMCFLSVARFCL